MFGLELTAQHSNKNSVLPYVFVVLCYKIKSVLLWIYFAVSTLKNPQTTGITTVVLLG
jgi:hypothetical protein